MRGVLYAAQPTRCLSATSCAARAARSYFLSRQDINGGSETVRVQVIDPDTGRVVSTHSLSAGVDYEIDYIQGVITLTRPLNSSASDGGLVGTGVGGSDVNLVVQYEYTPTTEDVDGFSFGGRLEAWMTDDLRLGVTAMNESTESADQRMASVDLHYRFGKASYIEAEVAGTEGPGFGRSLSSDGGLTITGDGPSGFDRALAYRFDSHLDFADLGLAVGGYTELYYESKEAGFSTLNEDITQDQRLIGLRTEVEASEQLSFRLDYEDFERDDGDRKARANSASPTSCLTPGRSRRRLVISTSVPSATLTRPARVPTWQRA